MHKRLFISIPLSDSFIHAFSSVGKAHSLKGIRWISAANLHLTVHFLGETAEAEIPALIERLKGCVTKQLLFELDFLEVCFAPPGNQKRMVWGVFKGSENFKALVKRVMGESSSREVIPHVTLARIRNPKMIEKIVLKQPVLPPGETLSISKIELQSSTLTPSGAHYHIIQSFPLRGMS